MALLTRRPSLRWILPILAALLLASGAATFSALSASARDSLPPRSAAQLLVDVQKAKVEGLSGTVVQTASLGLPALPNVAGGSSSDFTTLVSGSHTLRLWYAGPTKARVALLGTLGESDLIRNGGDVWLWSSSTNTAQHLAVPASADTPDAPDAQAGAGSEVPTTPQEAADMALAAITPTTTVTTDPTASVAGRPAYQLVLEPKDPGTLIGTVRIAIDGATHIPTRVQVFARGASTPAFEVGFTSFDPTVPDDSVFDFNPPPGAKVSDGLTGMLGKDGPRPEAPASAPATDQADPATARPTVVGDGWTSVVVATLPQDAGTGESGGSLGSLRAVVDKLPTVSGSWGSGHLLRGTLFSVLLTDDGRVAAGSVAPEALYAALSAS